MIPYMSLDAQVTFSILLIILVPFLDLLLQGGGVSPSQHVNLHFVPVKQEGGHGRHPLALGRLLGNKGSQGQLCPSYP